MRKKYKGKRITAKTFEYKKKRMVGLSLGLAEGNWKKIEKVVLEVMEKEKDKVNQIYLTGSCADLLRAGEEISNRDIDILVIDKAKNRITGKENITKKWRHPLPGIDVRKLPYSAEKVAVISAPSNILNERYVRKYLKEREYNKDTLFNIFNFLDSIPLVKQKSGFKLQEKVKNAMIEGMGMEKFEKMQKEFIKFKKHRRRVKE